MKLLLLNFSLLLLNVMVTSRNIFLDNDDEGKRYKDPFEDLSFRFSCEGRPFGFYADVEYDCTIFHVCTETGDRIPALCPPPTLFDQRQRMCTDEEFACDQSERWYYLDSSNYYTYFMESKKNAEVMLEEIDVYTVKPLEDD